MPDDGQEPPENVTPLHAKRRGRKTIDPNVLEIGRILREAPELGAGTMFRYDTFSGRNLLMRPVPRPDLPLPTKHKPRDTSDNDITHLMEWLLANGFKKQPSMSVMALAIAAEAKRNAFSSARDALDRLPAWDGVYRLESFFTKVCGAQAAEEGDDDLTAFKRLRYLAAIGKCLFMSIVARITRPGCKVDTTVILEGPQGSLKSTLLRVIALDRDDWFSDSMAGDVGTKDAKIHLRGKLIIELAELAQFQRKQTATLKGFLSAQDDKYRPPYERGEGTPFPRQCVFVGTTNHTTYLIDETGNRRFWPIKCGKIDIDLARELMPQLYAEAIREINQPGAQWHLPADIEAIAAEEQAERTSQDPWTERAQELVEERKHQARNANAKDAFVYGEELLKKVGMPEERWDKQVKDRAGSVLSQLGGLRHKRRIRGIPLQGFRFALELETGNNENRWERSSY